MRQRFRRRRRFPKMAEGGRKHEPKGRQLRQLDGFLQQPDGLGEPTLEEPGLAQKADLARSIGALRVEAQGALQGLDRLVRLPIYHVEEAA